MNHYRFLLFLTLGVVNFTASYILQKKQNNNKNDKKFAFNYVVVGLCLSCVFDELF